MIGRLVEIPGQRGRLLATAAILLSILASPPGGPVAKAQAVLTWTMLAGDRMTPGQFNQPDGVAVDGEGNVYVEDSGL